MHDDRPIPQLALTSDVLNGCTIDTECIKTVVTRVLGFEPPSALQIPEHLCNSLFRLVGIADKRNVRAAVAKKLSPGETQVLVDFLDLSIHIPTGRLLTDIMGSTHTVPQSCKVSGVQYDPAVPIAIGPYAKTYRCYSGICVIMPSLENGALRNYAPTIPQKSRLLLISDIINGLAYLHNTWEIYFGGLDGESVIISDVGRAMVAGFGAQFLFAEGQSHDKYLYYCWRFNRSPPSYQTGIQKDIWSLGCVCYEGPMVELLRDPLLKLIKNRTKDVAEMVAELESNNVHAIVDFLDQVLKDHLSISDEQNCVLAILSRITSATHIFPRRYELNGVKYCPKPIAEGGFGSVHQGVNTSMCIKVMKRLDPDALTLWIKELILWAQSSHPNIVPFYGVFVEEISDVVHGLHYLHELGIVHGDLKGQNILISNKGCGLITDFGTSHITTATAASGSLSATTLHFLAPEMILGNKKPSKEFDIWLVGCLFYEVLSHKAPYHEYKSEVQIMVALSHKEPPTRPGTTTDMEEKDDRDDDFYQDWDTIDNQVWSLIMKCCNPEPEHQLNISTVKELVVDLKIWDDRPPMKSKVGVKFLNMWLDQKIDLNHVEELLNQVQLTLDDCKAPEIAALFSHLPFSN
ncbi:Cytokinesis protein sepH [Leucoagaricus sp. SymC.cos]|nr:Cytokinesis protein sepH [Leucoagaricus sp. SymC.cos]